MRSFVPSFRGEFFDLLRVLFVGMSIQKVPSSSYRKGAFRKLPVRIFPLRYLPRTTLQYFQNRNDVEQGRESLSDNKLPKSEKDCPSSFLPSFLPFTPFPEDEGANCERTIHPRWANAIFSPWVMSDVM